MNILEKLHPIIAEDVQDVLSRCAWFSALQGSTLCVTGAGSLLTSYLLYAICAYNDVKIGKPCKLLLVTRRPPEVYSRLQPLLGRNDVDFLVKDVSQSGAISELDFDWFIHAASPATAQYYTTNPVQTAAANVIGLHGLLESARRQHIFGGIFFSSGQIYGYPSLENVPTAENWFGPSDPMGDRAAYDESKRFGETLCQAYAKQFGISVRVVRPIQVFGPGVDSDDPRALPYFVQAASRGSDIILNSPGTDLRSYCYLTDATVQMASVLFRGENGEAYNIGNSTPLVSILELAHLVASVSDSKVSVRVVVEHDRPGGSPSVSSPDVTKVTKLAGSVKVSLEEMVVRMLQWAV